MSNACYQTSMSFPVPNTSFRVQVACFYLSYCVLVARRSALIDRHTWTSNIMDLWCRHESVHDAGSVEGNDRASWVCIRDITTEILALGYLNDNQRGSDAGLILLLVPRVTQGCL